MNTLDRLGAKVFPAMLGVVGLLMVVGLVLPGGGPTTAGFEPMSAPARPETLVVPSLKIRAPVLKIEVNAQAVLDPPRNPRDVGWWQRSARPGSKGGQTVLTGHTVHTGGGVMDRLGALKRGQTVRVRTSKGTMVYRTTRVVTWSKAELARQATAIFNQKRAGNRLVLITCSGWTGTEYLSNIVVFAKPLGVRQQA